MVSESSANTLLLDSYYLTEHRGLGTVEAEATCFMEDGKIRKRNMKARWEGTRDKIFPTASLQ